MQATPQSVPSETRKICWRKSLFNESLECKYSTTCKVRRLKKSGQGHRVKHSRWRISAYVNDIFAFLHRSFGEERCRVIMQCVRRSVRPPRNITGNKRLDRETLVFAYIWMLTNQVLLSSKSSTFLTFAFKIKYSIRVYREVHKWLSRKLLQIGQALHLPIHRKSHVDFRFTFDLAPF